VSLPASVDAASGCLALLIWLGLALFRGGFWRLKNCFLPEDSDRSLRSRPPSPGYGRARLSHKRGRETARVAAVIPARNEAESIACAVRSLLTQRYAGSIRVFVVDDDSSDGTASLAAEAAVATNALERLIVLRSEPLPAGWTGKLWAVSQGIREAAKWNPDFLLLTDADVEHDPSNVAQLVEWAESESLDLTSLMVKLHCESFAERLLIPAFVYFFFLLYPPGWTNQVNRRTASAAGGCMLIRPAVLEGIGGIEAIRGEIIDDCALARAVKQTGGRLWIGLSKSTQSRRAYGSFGEISQMISRTAFNQLRHSAALLAGTIAGLIVIYCLPIALTVTGRPLPAILGGAAWLLMTATFVPLVRFYGLPVIWALALPAAAAFYMAATIHSAWKHWTGHGGEWKGRTQDAAHR
jgi:hopene-associated glycosyltransferase HpnB